MQRLEDVNLWMGRSLSNLERARSKRENSKILLEDLCFDIQQSAEKALKAVCIKEEIIFKRTHDISYLIDLLENEGIEVPDPVKNGRYLTQYAVETRYPGVYEPIEEDEFMEALKDAEAIFGWAMNKTGYENFEEKNEGHEETDIHD